MQKGVLMKHYTDLYLSILNFFAAYNRTKKKEENLSGIMAAASDFACYYQDNLGYIAVMPKRMSLQSVLRQMAGNTEKAEEYCQKNCVSEQLYKLVSDLGKEIKNVLQTGGM